MLDHQEAMLKSLVAVAWADGRMEDTEKEVIEALISAFELTSTDATTVRDYAKTPRTIEDVPLTELSSHDRRLLLQHAVILTFIDGKQCEKEAAVLGGLVRRLGIPEPEAKELLGAATFRAKRLLELL